MWVLWVKENWRLILEAVVVGLLGAVIVALKLQLGAAQVAEAGAKRDLAQYKADVQEASAKQSREALAVAVANERKKEQADAQNAAALAAARADAGRMRNERDAALARFLSTAPAASKCPDDQACFDRAEFSAAYRALVGTVREVADECSAVTVDLNSAKLWALNRSPPAPSSAP